MWTGLHRYTNLKVLVEKFIVAVGGFLDRNRPNGRSVKQQLHLVRLRVPQAVDVSGITASEVDLDVVLPVLREIVTNRNPTTSPDRESRYMLFLRDVFRDANDVALHRGLHATDRQPADLLRSRDVSFQQSGRQIAHRDVVEAVTAFIGGQERCGVNVDQKQVSDGVLILATIQTSQRVRAARIRLRGGSLVERRFQPRQEGSAIFRRRLRHVGRRHGARAKLTNDLLPDFAGCTRNADVRFVQHQAGCLELLVVAGHTVAINHPALA